MKLLLVLLAFLLVSCGDEVSPPERVVSKKYCVSTCMSYEFRKFHNSGETFSGSSSMSGLNQSQIYDRVKAECVEFYKDERCCSSDMYSDGYRRLKSTIHGYTYGPCEDNK